MALLMADVGCFLPPPSSDSIADAPGLQENGKLSVCPRFLRFLASDVGVVRYHEAFKSLLLVVFLPERTRWRRLGALRIGLSVPFARSHCAVPSFLSFLVTSKSTGIPFTLTDGESWKTW